MASSSTAYGVTAPSGLDPFPIETELAKIVGGNNPSNASNLLDLYQVQNQTSQGNYNYNLNQQHDFAKQQLAQQLKETYLKEAMTAVQHRGGTTLLRAMGGLQGVDPSIDTAIEGGLTGLQNANIFEKVGAGANQGAQAGLGTSLPLANQLTGGLFNREQTPTTLQNTQYRVNNAPEKRIKIMLEEQILDDKGRPHKINYPVYEDATDEEAAAAKANAIRLMGISHPQGSGIAGVTPPRGTTTSTPGPTSRPTGQVPGLQYNTTPAPTAKLPSPPPGVVSPDDPNNLLDPTIPADPGTAETAPPGAVAPPLPRLGGSNATPLPPYKPVQTMPPVQAPTANTSGPARAAAQPPAAAPAASRAAPTPPSGNAEAASGQLVLDQAIQNKAKFGFGLLTPDQKLDVQANIQNSESGAILPIVPLKGGGYGFVGRTSNVYKVPARGAN